MTPMGTAALLAGVLVAGCGDEVRYVVELRFLTDGVTAPGPDAEIRVNVCTDPEARTVDPEGRVHLGCAALEMTPEATPSAGAYAIPFDGSPPRLTLVGRPDSVESGVLFLRAWVSDGVNCCAHACSRDFLDLHGQLVDPTRGAAARVPQDVELVACPALVACTPEAPETETTCGCACTLEEALGLDPDSSP